MNKIVIGPNNLANTLPLDYIDAASQAGYDGIGLRLYRSPGQKYNFFPIVGNSRLMRDVKGALVSSGLQPWDIFSYYLQPEMDWDSIEAQMHYAGELGAKYVLVIGDDPEWGRMRDSFGRLCDMVAPMGLSAVIEVTVRELKPLSKAVQFLAEASRDNVGLVIDPCQTMRDEGTYDVIKSHDPKLFPYAQLNDTTIIGRMGHLPGEGILPLDKLLDALPAGLPLSLEAGMFGPPRYSEHTDVDWARMGLDSTRRVLANYYASKKEH
jgi:sugar phosphate isomerase/epimerase